MNSLELYEELAQAEGLWLVIGEYPLRIPLSSLLSWIKPIIGFLSYSELIRRQYNHDWSFISGKTIPIHYTQYSFLLYHVTLNMVLLNALTSNK
jgi:hypothetical protein